MARSAMLCEAAVTKIRLSSINSKKLFDKVSRVSAQAHIGADDVKPRSGGRSQIRLFWNKSKWSFVNWPDFSQGLYVAGFNQFHPHSQPSVTCTQPFVLCRLFSIDLGATVRLPLPRFLLQEGFTCH
jgi:hypothetical protein